MSDELTVGRIEELTREHGAKRLALPSVNGYVLTSDVLDQLRRAKAALAAKDEEIERLTAELDALRMAGVDSRYEALKAERDRLAACVERVRAAVFIGRGSSSLPVHAELDRIDTALSDAPGGDIEAAARMLAHVMHIATSDTLAQFYEFDECADAGKDEHRRDARAVIEAWLGRGR